MISDQLRWVIPQKDAMKSFITTRTLLSDYFCKFIVLSDKIKERLDDIKYRGK